MTIIGIITLKNKSVQHVMFNKVFIKQKNIYLLFTTLHVISKEHMYISFLPYLAGI